MVFRNLLKLEEPCSCGADHFLDTPPTPQMVASDATIALAVTLAFVLLALLVHVIRRTLILPDPKAVKQPVSGDPQVIMAARIRMLRLIMHCHHVL